MGECSVTGAGHTEVSSSKVTLVDPLCGHNMFAAKLYVTSSIHL